ncbi:MAG: FAD-dependent oxidoreductase [Phycisphaerae bacterium]|nr:FAD-dependent oxidoreductase [Phycisphaerae bacterium]
MTADVVVVGGGVMGLTSAWRMAQRGLKVTLIEANRCGSGASQAALGALWPPSATHTGPLQLLHRQSLWGFEEFADELRQAGGVAVDFLRQGRVELLSDAKAQADAVKEVAAARANWPPLVSPPIMELLASDDLHREEPAVTPWPAGALWCKLSAQVGVESLLAALQAACRRSGVIILENTRAVKLDISEGTFRGVHTLSEKIAAGKGVLTTGVGTDQFADLAKAAPIHPVRGQALLLNTGRQMIFRIIKNGKIFLVPWPDGRILVGSTTERQAGFDNTNTVEGVNFLLTGAVATCPALAKAKLEKIWSGLRPSGPHGRPIIGELKHIHGLVVAGGHFKIGIGMAPLTGEIIADLVAHGRCKHDIGPFLPRGSSVGKA